MFHLFYRYAHQNSFFVRKGFGEDYCKGILEGICDCKKMLESEISYEKIFLTILKYNWNCGAI